MRYLELVILGLLMEGPHHGYQIQQLIRQRHMDQYINLATSSMYKTLIRLEREGFVESHTERVGARPERRVYHITPEGEEYLKGLIRETLNEIQPYYDPLYAALTFAHYIPTEEVIVALERRREHYRGVLQHLKETEVMLKELEERYGVEVFYPQAIVRAGIKGVSAELEWLDEVLVELARRKHERSSNG